MGVDLIVVLGHCQMVATHGASVRVRSIDLAEEADIILLSFATALGRRAVIGCDLGVVQDRWWLALVQVGQDLGLAQIFVDSHLLRHVEYAVILTHIQISSKIA